MLKPRALILAAAVLLSMQAAVVARYCGQLEGVLLSDLCQLALGILCLFALIDASQRSRGESRLYWRWVAAAFAAWVLAQLLGTYIDLTSNHALDSLDDLYFFFSVIPFGMLLFLDPGCETNHFDKLHLLDLLQVSAFWVSIYLFFSKDLSIALTSVGWGPFGWTSGLVFNAVLTVSFLLRAVLSNSKTVRAMFGKMALFLLCSGLADSYASFAPNRIEPGHWFDMVWGLLLATPLLIAITSKYDVPAEAVPASRAQGVVIDQFFPLVYPFFSLFLLAQSVQREPVLAPSLIVVVFVAVGLRVLVIQHRLVRTQGTLEFEATHDGLTGLWNRTAILQRLDCELERHRRTGDPLGLLLVDVDHFKKVNDTWGHAVGDEVLRGVARHLQASVRSYDSVARYGGEEFLVIVPNCNRDDAYCSAERLRRAVATWLVPSHSGPIAVAVSVGLASTSDCGSSLDGGMLLRMADEALYKAKTSGRNRVECALPVAKAWTTGLSQSAIAVPSMGLSAVQHHSSYSNF